MDMSRALSAFGALGQETRLQTVRLLVRAGCCGLRAGQIAAHLGIRHNLMSNHLNILSRAGLVRSERSGRTIVYRADFDALRALVGYLVNDCCAGLPEIVGTLEATDTVAAPA